MKRRILFILSFILIFCAGCTANYNVVINKDGTVEEKLYAYEKEEFFQQYPKSSKGLVISYILEPYLDKLNENNYTVENNITETNAGVNITKKYSSFEDYVKNSIIYNQFTDEIKYDKNGKKETISLTGNFCHSDQNQEIIPVDNGSIAITVPYKVDEQNADKVNETSYLWNFDEDDDEREIKISFDSSKDANYSYLPIIGLISVLIFILILGFILYNNLNNKRKNANKL